MSWLRTNDGILAAKLADSQVSLASEKTVHLEVMEIFQDVINEPQALAKLTNAAHTFFGQAFQWVVRAKAAPTATSRDEQKARRTKGNPRRSIMEHPVVLQALDILGGELIDIRPLKPDPKDSQRGEEPPAPGGGPVPR